MPPLFDLSSFVESFATVEVTIIRADNNSTLDPNTGRYSTPTTTSFPIKAKFQPVSKGKVDLVPEGYLVENVEEMHTTADLNVISNENSDETSPSDSFVRNGKVYLIIGEYLSNKENGNFNQYIVGTK